MKPAQPVTSARIRVAILRAMPRHDVAIYMPLARIFYDARADFGAGGAERQTWLLARELTARGLRVAHVVLPITERLDPSDGITLVQRPEPASQGGARALAE